MVPEHHVCNKDNEYVVETKYQCIVYEIYDRNDLLCGHRDLLVMDPDKLHNYRQNLLLIERHSCYS